MLELENALVNDDDYAAGENKYNIPQLKKYIDDNFYSQTQANNKTITREEITENSSLYNKTYEGVFNKEYVVTSALTESSKIRISDNNERPYNSFVFKTGSISNQNFNFEISLPGSNPTLQWSTIKPQYISDCYYHIEIIKANDDMWLASWTMY